MDVLYIRILTLFAQVVWCGANVGICHDDFELHPSDGELERRTIPWLAVAQYEHMMNLYLVRTGKPHGSKAPRVTLVDKQFVLGTASDLMNIPMSYKLGKIIFGDYIRDEVECGLTRNQRRLGVQCARAFLEMPIDSVLPHPEYVRLNIKISINCHTNASPFLYYNFTAALRTTKEDVFKNLDQEGHNINIIQYQWLKHIIGIPTLMLDKIGARPARTFNNYMLPICLPTRQTRLQKQTIGSVFLIDYVSASPANFATEYMAKISLELYTEDKCAQQSTPSWLSAVNLTHLLCSTGCGVRPGTPIVHHATSGPFVLMGISAASGRCRLDQMRRRLNREPPLYIDVYPYVGWITNVINAHLMPMPHSQRYQLSNAHSGSHFQRAHIMRQTRMQKQGWKGKMFMSGNWCFAAEQKRIPATLFYMETFIVRAPEMGVNITVNMQLSSGYGCRIVCARLLMPHRIPDPTIIGVPGNNITVVFNTEDSYKDYYYTLGLTAKNASTSEEEKNCKLFDPNIKQTAEISL